MRTLLLVVAAALLTACGGDGGGTGTSVISTVEMTVSPDVNSLQLGDQVQLTATPKDLNGRTISGVGITFSSTDTSILTVTASGLVTAQALGFATITATAGAKTGRRDFSVVRPPPGSVTISPDPVSLSPGATQLLTATVRDPSGALVSSPSLTWKSSDNSKATVSPVSGTNTATLTGVAAGAVTITAVARTDTGKATAAIVTSASPQITGVSPSPLRPGGTATITGSNFSATPSSNLVTIDGVSAVVTAATPTQLSIALPATGFACRPTGSAGVLVQVGSEANVFSHPLQVATQRRLDVGGSFRVDQQSAVRCNELTGTGGRYIISVYNTSTATGLIDFTLRGAAGSVGGEVAPPVLALGSQPALRPAPRALGKADGPRMRGLRRRAAAHSRLMEANRRFALQRVGQRPPAALRTVPGGPSVAPTPTTVKTTEGAINSVRIPDLEQTNFCTKYIATGARTAYVGTKAIILEDTANTTAGKMDAYYQQVGEEFDTAMWAVLRGNFGDPLVMDSQLSSTGKVVMVFSEKVNDMSFSGGGVLGFVVSCDFFSREAQEGESGTPSSNEGEYFYARAATSTTTGFDSTFNGNEWLRELRPTLVHEAKHIVSFGTRIAGNASAFEDQWLEEATAVHAEELWARGVYPNGWKDNSTYAQTLYYDVRPSSGKPFVMFGAYAYLYDYLSDTENESPLGESVGASNYNAYGSAWSLVRWAADNYATDEAAFFTALTQETSLTGTANLAARTGRPFGVMLGDWSLALFADDYSGVTPDSAQLRVPSWNTRDIFAGMNADGFRDGAFPVVPRAVRYGTFGVDASVRSGSMSYFELSGTQSGPQLIEVRSPGGNDPAPPLRVAVMRVQ